MMEAGKPPAGQVPTKIFSRIAAAKVRQTDIRHLKKRP